MRKFSTKKSNEVAKFELNPLNATMRAAVKTGLMARTFRKATPVMIASVAAVGATVWAPELQAQTAATLTSTTITAPAGATPSSIVPTVVSRVDRVFVNVTVGTTAIEITNNSSYGTGGTPLGQQRSEVNFLSHPTPTTIWGPVSLAQELNWITTFDLGGLSYDSVEVSMAGSGTAANQTGTSTVNTGTGGTISNGILGSSFGAGSESLTIRNGGTIYDGRNNDAINIIGGGNLGRLTITNDGVINVNSTLGNPQGSGIDASRVGQVAITNTATGDEIFGTYAGIFVHDIGSGVALLSGVNRGQPTVDITNGGMIEGDVGIYVLNVTQTPGEPTTGDVLITNTGTGVVSGRNGVGIAVVNVDDGVEIDNSGDIFGRGNSAAFAQSAANAVDPPFYGVNLGGNFHGAGLAIYNAGGALGSSDQVIITNSGRIVGDRLDNLGNGFFGVYAESNGDIRVDNTGTIQGDGQTALFLTNTGGIATSADIIVTVGNSGRIQDESLDPSRLVVEIFADDSASLTIGNGGTVRGRIRMDSGIAPETVTFTNRGVWEVEDGAGNAFFGTGGTVSVVNTDGGQIRFFGDSTIGGQNSFANDGGILDLTSDGNATTTDVVIRSDFSGNTLGVLNQSRVLIDATLTQALASDTLFINGAATGVTSVVISDTAPNTAGVNDPTGITVIQASNGAGTLPGAFVLDGGPINKGLWQYDLFTTRNGANRDFRIASAPSEHAHELPVLQSAAQEAWHQSAAAWLDHTNNVRMRLDEGNVVKGGAWARIVGADIERKNTNLYTQSVYGQVISHENNYEQDIYGVMFGADGAIELANGGTWLLGLTAGVTQSKVNFTTSTTDMDYTAGSVGAYASFVRGGGFFNALLKADMGSTDYKMSNGNGISANESFQTSAFGVMLDGGYRFRSGVAFLEPSVSVASVSAKIKDKEFLATNVDFSNGTSLRTKLTLASGFSAAWGGTRFEPYLALSAVHESDGENEVSLTSGGVDTPVQVKDKQVETYGQVGLGLKVVGAKGSSGFLKVEHAPSASDNDTTKGDAKREATTVSAGVKLTW